MLRVAILGLLLKPAWGGSNPSRMLSHGAQVVVVVDIEVDEVVVVTVLLLVDVEVDEVVAVLAVVLDEVEVVVAVVVVAVMLVVIDVVVIVVVVVGVVEDVQLWHMTGHESRTILLNGE